MVSRKALTRSYRRGCKSLDGFAYYDLGLLHEHRAEAAASRLFEDGMSDLLEREWVEAVHNADACFRTALRQGIPGAASSRLHPEADQLPRCERVNDRRL